MASADVLQVISNEQVVLEQNTDPAQINPSATDIPEAQPYQKKKKVPRRILHFSDGILEEYSTDEEEEEEEKPLINTKSLAWIPWFWYYTVSSFWGALSVADTCGEKLAWALGITSPKYQFAIDEYNKLKEEEEEEQRMMEREKAAAQERESLELATMEGGVKEGNPECQISSPGGAPASQTTDLKF